MLVRSTVRKILDMLRWKRPLLIKEISIRNLERGIIGFVVISGGLLIVQAIVVIIGRTLTEGLPYFNSPYMLYSLTFYLVAFSLPFWLTITSEYAIDIE